MASTKQKGQYYGLYVVDVASPEVDTLIACLNNKGFKIANKVIDGTSDCGPDFAAGFPNSSLSFKGFMDYANATTYSGDDMTTWAINQTIKDFVLKPIGTPVKGDATRRFSGFISSYEETFNTDQFVEFNVTLQVQGNITQTITP